MNYGYVRVSTKKQNIDRQVCNISTVCPDAVIYSEKMTGTTCDRPQVNKLLATVKPGDTIYFDSVSRMSRNAEEGFKIYDKLYDIGVNLVFLNEPHINTDSYKKAFNTIECVSTGDRATDSLVNGIMSAVNTFLKAKVQEDIKQAFMQSEKEVQDIRKRVSQGLRESKKKGTILGHRSGTTVTHSTEEPIKALIVKYSKDFDGHNNDKDLLAIINSKQIIVKDKTIQAHISRNTLYKYKKELKGGVA